jgi:hypothetical protein
MTLRLLALVMVGSSPAHPAPLPSSPWEKIKMLLACSGVKEEVPRKRKIGSCRRFESLRYRERAILTRGKTPRVPARPATPFCLANSCAYLPSSLYLRRASSPSSIHVARSMLSTFRVAISDPVLSRDSLGKLNKTLRGVVVEMQEQEALAAAAQRRANRPNIAAIPVVVMERLTRVSPSVREMVRERRFASSRCSRLKAIW